MPTGIILSTQSPENKTTFPRRGGTGAGINHVTGFPVIKMHRDAKSRPDEQAHFNQIKDGSLVFITGHSNTALDHIGGGYTPAMSSPVQPLSTDWTYKQFRDLILGNGNLKPGDTLTIVLWACNAGEGGLSSGAALLGRLFREKKINTRIISSVGSTMRFHGEYSTMPDGSPSMQFETEHGANDIRIFDFTAEKTIVWKNKKPLYTTLDGIKGYNLYSPKQLESLEGDQIGEVLEALFSDEHYKENVRTPNEITAQLSKPKMDFILRWSSANDTDAVNKYIYIAASFKTSDGIMHLRYGINKNGELFLFNFADNNKATKLDILPEGIVTTLTEDITRYKDLIEESLLTHKTLAPRPRQQHVDDHQKIVHLNGEKELPSGKTHHHKKGEKELPFMSVRTLNPITPMPSPPKGSAQENQSLSMMVSPMHVQQFLQEATTKKEHKNTPRTKLESQLQTPSAAKKEPKIDLSKRQQIPVVQKKKAAHRDSFFSVLQEPGAHNNPSSPTPRIPHGC